MKLSEVLHSPAHWTKGELYRDAFDAPSTFPSVKSCLYGACFIADPVHAEELYAELAKTLEAWGEDRGPIHFNDAPDTTFANVQQLIRETEERLSNAAL